MATTPIRIPEEVKNEVAAASRILGCNAAELLERAWTVYRETPQFREDLEISQKAFFTGDLAHITQHMSKRSEERAKVRAARVQGLRVGS